MNVPIAYAIGLMAVDKDIFEDSWDFDNSFSANEQFQELMLNKDLVGRTVRVWTFFSDYGHETVHTVGEGNVSPGLEAITQIN